MDTDYFTITNESNENILCQKLLDFEHNGNKYIIYTDFSVDGASELEVLASKYHLLNGEIILDGIDNPEEWEIIDKKWEEYTNE